MKPIEYARSILSNIPDEMFNAYLSPIIKEHGFPFTNIHDAVKDHLWFGYFSYLPLKTFANLKWQRYSNLVPSNISFKESSVEIVKCIIAYNLTDKWTIGNRPLRNCKERFRFHVRWIQRTGNLFAPVILRPTTEGLLVIDGSHRLAALFSMERYDDVLIDAWIGLGQ